MVRPAIGFLLLSAVLGCGGSSAHKPEPPQLRVVNGMRAENIKVEIDGAPVGGLFSFGDSGPETEKRFYSLSTGTHSLRILTADNTVLLSQPLANFRLDEISTVFVSGTRTAPQIVGANDFRALIDYGRATLRIAHGWSAGPASVDVYVTRPDDAIAGKLPTAENVSLGSSLGPYVFDSGELRYRICTPGTQTVLLDRTVRTQNGLSSVLLIDDAAASGAGDLVVVP